MVIIPWSYGEKEQTIQILIIEQQQKERTVKNYPPFKVKA